MVCRYISAKSLASMPEPERAITSFSGSWFRTRKNFLPYALARTANASIRLSCWPAATLAQFEPYAIFQFISSTRGCAGSEVIAISSLVGKISLPLWYVWKMVAVRPLSFSQVFSSTSRGLSVKPPAAAPHSAPHDGTSSAPVLQAPDGAGAVAGGVAGAVVAGAVVAGSVVGAVV